MSVFMNKICYPLTDSWSQEPVDCALESRGCCLYVEVCAWVITVVQFLMI